jgi:antitoxin (DNA-binding transcriptional repressor) of toxin-antitoxin stability system
METIGIAEFKSHLSSELKKVAEGETLVVRDHRKPVAWVVPVPTGLALARKASRRYMCPQLEPLIARDPLDYLSEERADR